MTATIVEPAFSNLNDRLYDAFFKLLVYYEREPLVLAKALGEQANNGSTDEERARNLYEWVLEQLDECSADS